MQVMRSLASRALRRPLASATRGYVDMGASVLALPPRPLAASERAIAETVARHVSRGAEDPFYVVDLEAPRDKLREWRALLPDVSPFYAVKCNPDPRLLSDFADAGIGFDCASIAEISSVLSLGVSPERVVYANPCKQPSHMRAAVSCGVGLSVFDSESELLKSAAHAPGSELLLRIGVDDSRATCTMSQKYGAPLDAAPFLLRRARELGLTVRGVSFHVGSGCYAPDAFADAVARAAHVFDASRALGGAEMDTLDIGGGFPGVDTEELAFADIAAAVRTALREHFGVGAVDRGVRVIAEPGRFLAAASHTLAVNVIGKKVRAAAAAESALAAAAGEHYDYYINDGLYGSFNCVMYDHASPTCAVLPTPDAPARAAPTHPSSLWGPTCDGLDCVSRHVALPELEVGAWLYFPNMGAYTAAAGSNFNGMPLPSKLYLPPPLRSPAHQLAAAVPPPPPLAADLALRVACG